MLVAGAKHVAHYGFPQSRDEWLKIPGVGKYTAAAIASICLSEPTAVVDGNVERVVSRLTCDPATGSRLKDNTWIWADNHLVAEEPGEWNQAMMELGATVCKPTQPLCTACPIRTSCIAFQKGRVSEFPSAKPKPVTIKYQEELLIPLCDDEIGILESHELTWWKGLSLLPLSSTFQDSDDNAWTEHLGEIHYTVTNHKITAIVSLKRFEVRPEGLTWIPKDKINEVPLPAPHRKAIQLLYKT
jgi:A/G-specific adenine glycosylase